MTESHDNFEIERRVGTLETGLQLVSKDVQALTHGVSEVSGSVADFRREWGVRNFEEQKSKQEQVVARTLGVRDYVIMGASLIAGFSALFAGFQYIIHSTTDATQASMSAQLVQITERANSTSTALTSIRDAMQMMNTQNGDLRVANGRVDDRVLALQKFKEAFEARDFSGQNAKQDADIASLKLHSEAVDRAIEKMMDRFPQAAPKKGGPIIVPDRTAHTPPTSPSSA